jgi:predicted transcriptional regulator
MGAPRITPSEIIEMQRLYKELGTYAAVAREMGRSASAVSKYVQMKGVPNNIRLAVETLSQQTA